MSLIVQYPDLTEVMYSADVYPENFNSIKTEFAFYLAAYGCSDSCEKLGFKKVSSMNNWWPSHHGETRTMTLYWLKVPHSTGESQLAMRKRWYRDDYQRLSPTNPWKKIYQHIAGSGCAFKIGELPFKVSLFHRFFTLMRLPVEVSAARRRVLERYNFRFLDTGKLSSYWINGWVPEEYTPEKEYAYFKTTPEEWSKTGMKEYEGEDF